MAPPNRGDDETWAAAEHAAHVPEIAHEIVDHATSDFRLRNSDFELQVFDIQL